MFSSEHVIQNRESTSRVSVCEFLLALLIMCAMPSTVTCTIGISKARTLAPSVSLLIGQLMSGNLLYLKSLLNPMVYARRLTKYRQAFYKSFRRKKNGKYSKKERGTVTQQYENMKWQSCQVSPRLLFLSVLRILS